LKIKSKKIGENKTINIREFPIIIHPEHGVFKAASMFIKEQALWRSLRPGSLHDIAYIICDWCNYLQQQGIKWNQPSEQNYWFWLAGAFASGEIARNRQGHKANIIVRWVHFLASREIGGDILKSFAVSISQSPLDVADMKPKGRFKAQSGPKVENGRRPIPSTEEVDRILETLATNQNAFIAERNYLLGLTAVRTGLRAMGLASLTCKTLNMMLRSHNLIDHAERIELMVNNQAAKVALRAGLNELSKMGGENLITLIKEKGGKQRDVSFPISLVLSLIEYVWGERALFLKKRGKNVSSVLWVSEKGKRCTTLKRKSISDILRKQGFVASGVRGSGHCLRGAFLTDYACMLVLRAKRRLGPDYDSRDVLLQLAEVAGHEDPETLRPYLDEARIRLVLVGNENFMASEAL
jgi:site-specific recombinase XerD